MTDPNQEDQSEAEETMLAPIDSGSTTSSTLPPVANEKGNPHPAWSTPASDEEVLEATRYLMKMVEPEAPEGRPTTMYNALKTRDYSRAELLLVMKELPFDPDASHNYGRGFNPADVQRIVDEHRQLRAKLDQALTSKQRDELIAEFPGEIDPDAFHCCGFDNYDNPLWRYAPHVDTDPKDPTPELGDGTPGAERQRDDGGSEPVPIEEAMPNTE